jgi:hypothetical protein
VFAFENLVIRIDSSEFFSRSVNDHPTGRAEDVPLS